METIREPPKGDAVGLFPCNRFCILFRCGRNKSVPFLFVFFVCFGSVNGHCQCRPGVGLNTISPTWVLLRSLRPENVDESLTDVCILGSHRAAEIHFDVLAVAEPHRRACHLEESPDPHAGLEGRSTYRHSVACYHLAGHACIFAADQNLPDLRIRQVAVVYNETVVELHEGGVRRAGVKGDHKLILLLELAPPALPLATTHVVLAHPPQDVLLTTPVGCEATPEGQDGDADCEGCAHLVIPSSDNAE